MRGQSKESGAGVYPSGCNLILKLGALSTMLNPPVVWSGEWAVCGAPIRRGRGRTSEALSTVLNPRICEAAEAPSTRRKRSASGLALSSSVVLNPRRTWPCWEEGLAKDKGCEQEGPCSGVRDFAPDSLWDLGEATSLI